MTKIEIFDYLIFIHVVYIPHLGTGTSVFTLAEKKYFSSARNKTHTHIPLNINFSNNIIIFADYMVKIR